MQGSAGAVQRMVKFKSPPGQKGCRGDGDQDQEENGVFDQQDYIQSLGTDNAEGNHCRNLTFFPFKMFLIF